MVTVFNTYSASDAILRYRTRSTLAQVMTCCLTAPSHYLKSMLNNHQGGLVSEPEDNSLQWRHNEHGSVSNHQPHHCLLNRLFRRSWKKISKFCVLAFVQGIHRRPVNSPHKRPVTRKGFRLMTSSCSWKWSKYLSLKWVWKLQVPYHSCISQGPMS